MGSTDAQSAVRDLLSRLNDAWINKRGENMTNALDECFAEDAVVRGPGFALAAKGRHLAVQSYQDFVTHAQIKNIFLEPADIDVIAETAVAQYKWEITYVLGEQEHTDRGRDLFVLSHSSGRWLVVWRALLT